jgi:lipopolysaccharide export LptBFGC system permease protein LptF
MDEDLYNALDTETRRRYDLNRQKRLLIEEEERRQQYIEKFQMDTQVRWFIVYVCLALVLLGAFVSLYFWDIIIILDFIVVSLFLFVIGMGVTFY